MIKTYNKFREYLEEKLLILGGGKKYEQAVILSGGAGSGKTFATNHFIQGENYKILNVDDLKELVIKLSKSAQRVGLSPKMQVLLPQVTGMDMRNPEHTSKLHQLMKNFDPEEKRISQILFNPGGTRTYLPNLMFDCTLKSQKDAYEIVGTLRAAGYKPENIHIVWVLTDYKIALRQNYQRGRRIFNDILLDTHLGAKMTMDKLVFGDYSKLNINGDVAVIIGGPKQKLGDMSWQDAGTDTKKVGGQSLAARDKEGNLLLPGYVGKPYEKGVERDWNKLPTEWAKNFSYFRLKKAGKQGIDDSQMERINWFMSLLAPNEDKEALSKTLDLIYPETSKSK